MLQLIQILNKRNLIGVTTIFCYVFSFYIIGPITSSMIIAIPYSFMYIYNKEYLRQDVFSVRIFYCLILILFFASFYTIIHVVFDFSYLKVMVAQAIHLLMGVMIVTMFIRKYKFTSNDIEKYIVLSFFIQSIIEIVASVTPSFAAALLPFNRAYEFAESESGRRGLALAAGTGWSLGLAYGLLYIVFVKRYLLDGINGLKIFVGVVLLAGTMFAGRTGFVGAVFGMILFLLNANKGISYKIFIILKILLFVIIACFSFYICFPVVAIHLVDNVFPFAFEPFYKLFYNGEFSTSSTDRLQEMWEVTITPWEIISGTGNFTDPSGSYYKHIDIGIMRNLFYWGILGYLLMIVYQLLFLVSIRIHSTDRKLHWNMRVYRFCLIVYLFVMEFKAMVIGFNKMSMSIVFLLAYFYYYEYRKQKQRAVVGNYTML